MNASLKNEDRQILPRWRSFSTTKKLKELDSSVAKEKSEMSEFIETSLIAKKEEWENNKTIPFASDLLGSAIVLGDRERARDAAEFLLANSHQLSRSCLNMTKAFLDTAEKSEEKSSDLSRQEIFGNLRGLKRRRTSDPRNALVHIDMARMYVILGQIALAEKAVKSALALDRENRFVLRCASRFFQHIGEYEKAHDVLRRSSLAKSDPWILAAEIAFSEISGHRSRGIKHGLALASSGKHSPYHIAELLGVLATVEHKEGGSKKSRQLFEKSLIDPTENAVAQAVLFSHMMKKDFKGLNFSLANSYEAKASHLSIEARTEKNWEDALEETKKWLSDQPFSSRPAIHASFISGSILENFQETSTIAESALRSNPGDVTLLNNLAFSLINQGDLVGAADVLRRIDVENADPSRLVAVKATQGMLDFRSGNIEKGKEGYLAAIKLAQTEKDTRLLALASIYFAQEALTAHLPDITQVLEDAKRRSTNMDDSRVTFLMKRLEARSKKR